jgi:hypothetical protein
LVVLAAAFLAAHGTALAAPQSLRSDVTIRKLIDTVVTGSPATRLVRDPRNSTLYYLKQTGQIFRINGSAGTSTLVYDTGDHGLSNAQGFAIAANGSMFLVGNEDLQTQTRARIVKGVLQANGARLWSVLASTAPYPKSMTAYDHRFNGIVVDPAGTFVYVNSGSRTDHGEEQSAGGMFPGLREAGLTACILRLPVAGSDIFLRNNRQWLRSNSYLFAEGTRNTFDMAFAPNGDLIGTENGPDRDHSEELNWLRQGRHYGFPWRIGGTDNPQQYPNYSPQFDLLLNPLFNAVQKGYFHNDPSFPPRPSVPLIEPIRNLGPDADKYRDPRDGLVKDASDKGVPFRTFTAHRSPLGLVFDTLGVLAPEFRGDAFMLSWTAGDPDGDTKAGPFDDAGQDLLHLNLTKTGTTYT